MGMRWNPTTLEFEKDEDNVFVPYTPLATRNTYNFLQLPDPDPPDIDFLKLKRIEKGIVLKQTVIIGLAATAREEARGCADAMVAAVTNGAKRARFRFNANYSYGGGCCSSSMRISGEIEGEVEY